MPHLRLECSSNIKPEPGFTAIFDELHTALALTGEIRRSNCKSRAIVAEDFLIGFGEGQDAFVHLDLRFVEGPGEELKQRLGEEMLSILLRCFEEAIGKYDTQITVEVRDITPSAYFKYPDGTLPQQ